MVKYIPGEMLAKTDILVVILLVVLINNVETEKNEYKFDEEYDYIIVGAGASGSVIANRLSANDSIKVLLLDVGWESNIFSGIPALTPAMYYFKENTVNYVMEKQENVGLSLKDQKISAIKGKGLGGTTIVDYMVYARGHKEDYNKWSALGNPGWSYEEVLPYFKKSEDCLIPNFNPEARSSGGELPISETDYKTKSVFGFIEACTESGLQFNEDYNSGDSLGVGFLQSYMKKGVKYDANRAFLKPIRNRRNLKVKPRAKVRKIQIDPKTKAAEGVEYKTWFSSPKAKARKEVIISAGSFGSPQLLMLSGIGPKEHLTQLGIEVIKDAPVGEVMGDHFTYPFLTYTVNQSITSMFSTLINPISALDYIFRHQGPYTVPSVAIEAVAFAQSSLVDQTSSAPDIELLFFSGSLNSDYAIFKKHEFRLSDEEYDTIFKPLEGHHVFNIWATHLHPQSTGVFKLKSKDPDDLPILNGNYLSDPENKDLKTLIESVRIMQKIGRSPALVKLGAKQVLTPAPGCEDEEVDSDEFWECQIRHLGFSLINHISTVKMGPEDDDLAVVDSQLRVYGIKNLRVADTSIIPVSLSGQTTAAAYMIGEKAASLILKDNV